MTPTPENLRIIARILELSGKLQKRDAMYVVSTIMERFDDVPKAEAELTND